MLNKILFIFCFIITISESKSEYGISISFGHSESKEAHNHGLAFKGNGAGFAFTNRSESENEISNAKANLNYFKLESKNIDGYQISFCPIELAQLYSIYRQSEHSFYFGFLGDLEYNYFRYPNFQMDESYWLSTLNFAPIILYKYNFVNSTIGASFSHSILSFASRPAEIDDPYAYSNNVSKIIKKVNSNFKFGSFNILRAYSINLNYKFEIEKIDFELNYNLEKLEYMKAPKFLMYCQNIGLSYSF